MENGMGLTLESTIIELNLTSRMRRILAAGQINTVGQLIARDSGDLLELMGFGLGSLEILRTKLAMHGFTLRGEDGVTVLDLVIADMRQLDTVSNLKPDALVSAYQNAIKLCIHLRQAIKERRQASDTEMRMQLEQS